MDLKLLSSQSVAVAVHTAASASTSTSLHEPPSTFSFYPGQEDGYNPPEIDQSHDVALVSKLLDRSYGCHGVCSEKILLWGLPGCGCVIPHPPTCSSVKNLTSHQKTTDCYSSGFAVLGQDGLQDFVDRRPIIRNLHSRLSGCLHSGHRGTSPPRSHNRLSSIEDHDHSGKP